MNWILFDEKVEQSFSVGDPVIGLTVRGEFKGVVAEITGRRIMIGAPDGRMVELPAEKVLPG
jgi:hypothetical protein